MRRPTYFLHSYGCQMNKLDSELVASRLVEAGYEPATDEDRADVVLLNTCAVRQHAEDRVWSKLGLLRVRKRTDPALVVGVLGCMAEEHQRSMLARMPHVDLVVGPSAFGDIDQKVELARQRNTELARQQHLQLAAARALETGLGLVATGDGISGDVIRRNVRMRPHRSQAWVSVMRGCNMPCSYCIVPATRGAEVSRPIEVIADEVERLCDDGVAEVTLLGQTVNAYGRDLGRDVNLARLLRRLHEIPALRRIAFITSHPNFLTADLIAAIAELPRIARYLHLPAQSGSDRVLRAMRRGYTAERYLARAAEVQERVPDVELHSDFIVGYPGETAEDFDLTVELMERVRFAQSYVFKYSPRPGTLAAEAPDDVPEPEKARRNQVLLEVQERHTRARNERLVGSVAEVLVEGESKIPGRLTGRTEHHRIVHFACDDAGAIGTWVQVRIVEALGHSLVGELCPAPLAGSPR
jgi:tRNA-2-methylthio-N6-dimethylallyladenosine synthase